MCDNYIMPVYNISIVKPDAESRFYTPTDLFSKIASRG